MRARARLPPVPFELKLTNGSTLHGICGHNDQAQAETVGLYWGLSNYPLPKAPTSWDSAMLGRNASVYTYWKCADYKAGTCVFV